MVVTSNRGPDEWLSTFADPIRAQSAVDRFSGNAYDFVIEGESYRSRQKPTRAQAVSQVEAEPSATPRSARRKRAAP